MGDSVRGILHSLPAPARALAASVGALPLRWRRYGPGFARRVALLRERDRWTRAQWHAYQRAELEAVLRRAATQVPHYRQRDGLLGRAEQLERWPVLEKRAVRDRPLDFVADDCAPHRLVPVHTSGTTGTPLLILRSAATEQTWYAMLEVRARNPWGVRWSDRWAILGGRLVVAAERERPPFWTVNWALNQLYLSSYHLTARFAGAYLDATARFAPRYLYGYTSALCVLAQFVLESGRTDLRPTVVITNAEPLYAHQRALIARAFQCPVVETYGMTEMGVMAVSCRAGYLHTWPDLGFVELLDADDRPVAPGEIGHVVTTSLINREQLLIRYRTGDMAVAMPEEFQCPCGNGAPVLASVEGRSDDLLYTRDGRRIGRLDPMFKGDLPIREAQVIQEAWDRFVIRYVPAEGCGPAHAARMGQELKARVGECEVRLEAVTAIERTAAGKFRAVVSRLSPDAVPSC